MPEQQRTERDHERPRLESRKENLPALSLPQNGLNVRVRRRFSPETVIEADLRLDLEATQVTVLFGPSGAGKTTVLRCLAGLERPDEGEVRFGGDVWSDAAAGVFLPPQQRRIGYLFQDFALFPHLTVEGNIGYGLRGLSGRERRRRVAELVTSLGLEDLRGRRPAKISGGQQQRVALARAVALRPRLLLLDEPLSALDTPTREQLRAELRKSLRELGTPAIVVTHDRTEALALADILVVMIAGRTRQCGPAQEIFLRPADLDVARAVGAECIVPARLESTQDGLAVFLAGTVRIRTTAVSEIQSSEGFLCIRGEDVLLARRADAAPSDRNVLPARVTAITREGALARVTLDCGFPLVALVTRPVLEELALAEGDSISAVVAAGAVHFVSRP